MVLGNREEQCSGAESDDKTSEEARQVVRTRHCDKPPTERDRGEHARNASPLLHVVSSVRSWARWCFSAQSPQDEAVGDMVPYDNCFQRNGPKQPCAPTVVAKDWGTNTCRSLVVPVNGADLERELTSLSRKHFAPHRTTPHHTTPGFKHTRFLV